VTRYVFREGLGVIEAHLAPPRTRGPRSSLPMPYIRSDGMSDTLNPANGQMYDSKSAYEKAVRAAGCEIVGDDPGFHSPKEPDFTPDNREIERDIKQAIDQLGGV
jgi:hypothetical protein